MITRRLGLTVFVIHTLLVLGEAVVNFFAFESWNLFFSFFLDFPLSVLFHEIVDSLAVQNRLIAAFSLHLIIGGGWWVFIVWSLSKVFSRRR